MLLDTNLSEMVFFRGQSAPTASPATACCVIFVPMSTTQLPELRPIPVSPNDDYMAGSDGQIYSRTKYAGFGRKERVDSRAGHVKSCLKMGGPSSKAKYS